MSANKRNRLIVAMAIALGVCVFVIGDLAVQRAQALPDDTYKELQTFANVIAVAAEAGGQPEQVARLIIYVTDRKEYKKRLKEIGERYRARMGKHFPAMVLVEVAGLLEDRAQIEIEGIAILK